MRAIPLIGQVLLLALVNVALAISAASTRRARRHYARLRKHPRKGRLGHSVATAGLNPVVLNGMIAFAAQCLGIALLAVSLNFGLWGYLSAPAFGAAITETILEFSDA
jgi:hypothetical protein